ncbi:hypothetical protein X975_11493, partial [Stegodyphus mimosarum]
MKVCHVLSILPTNMVFLIQLHLSVLQKMIYHLYLVLCH